MVLESGALVLSDKVRHIQEPKGLDVDCCCANLAVAALIVSAGCVLH